MESRDKKLRLLHQLSQETDPLSVKELLDKLEGDYSERTVRRWLAKIMKDGLVEKTGKNKAARYKIIQRSFRQGYTTRSCFGEESQIIVEKIRRPIYERAPVAYADDWFEAYQPNISFYIPLDSRILLHKAGMRLNREDPAGTYARQIFNRLLIDLSYNSSRLEGNTYSLLDAQKLLLEGMGAEGKLDEEKMMILNHKEAIRYLIDSAHRLVINSETISTLHYFLSEGLVEGRLSGKIRDHGVTIGGSTYLPFEDPKRLAIQLERIVGKAALIKDPYEQSLFLLVHISYLQAFSDVNKRTGRLSANIPLIKNNLVPLSFNDVERYDYTSAMISIYELQDVRPLIDLYLFSYMRTCAMYDSTVKMMGFDEIRVRYRQERRGVVRHIVLNSLFGKAIEEYAASQAIQLIKEADREFFVHDVVEDLEHIDQIRIVGMGITPGQLAVWLKARDSLG